MSATPSNVEHDVCLNQSLGPFVRALFFHFIGHRLRERLSAAAFLFFPLNTLHVQFFTGARLI